MTASNARLQEIEKALSDDRRVQAAQKKLAVAQKNSKNKQTTLKQVENKVEDQRLKRKLNQASLFGGKVTNPKVLQDLQMEAEALKRYIEKLEDEQLEAMIASETADEALKQAEHAHQQAKATAIEENASLLGEKTKLEEDLERLLREKEAVLQPITPASLAMYENLRKTKRGTAIACHFGRWVQFLRPKLNPSSLTIHPGSQRPCLLPFLRAASFSAAKPTNQHYDNNRKILTTTAPST